MVWYSNLQYIPLSTTVPVHIFFTMADTAPPRFIQDDFATEIYENQPISKFIMHIKAKDQNTEDNQNIEYSIKSASSSNDSDIFSINRLSEEISLKRSLDHERQVMHHFIVTATDKGPVPNTGEAMVLVNVSDSNDNSPVFEEENYSFVLSDTAQRGQFVGKVTAINPDISDQDKMRYSIIGGNKNQVFSIEKSSKVISLGNIHNFDTIQQYLLNFL